MSDPSYKPYLLPVINRVFGEFCLTMMEEKGSKALDLKVPSSCGKLLRESLAHLWSRLRNRIPLLYGGQYNVSKTKPVAKVAQW